MLLTASTGEEAVRMIPSLLWIVFAGVALLAFYRPIRYELLPRLSSLKLPGGIELTLKDRIETAARLQKVQVSEDDKTRIVGRLERLAPLLRGASILWVDDRPENNINEASILSAFGAASWSLKSRSASTELDAPALTLTRSCRMIQAVRMNRYPATRGARISRRPGKRFASTP
jgi:hypothetical protein